MAANGTIARNRSSSRRARRAPSGRCGASLTRPAPAPRTTRGSRSISRRTNRHSTPGVGARGDDRVEPLARRIRDRHEDDVGRRPLEQPAELVRAAERPATPCTRRRRRRGLSSTKPTHALARRLAQLAQQAAAGAAGADDQRPPAGAVAHTTRTPVTIARSASREADDRDRADQRVDHEERAREVAERPRQTRCTRARPRSETHDGDGDRSSVAAPA